MSTDSRPQDSRIGPAAEDSRNDLDADQRLQSQHGSDRHSRRDAPESTFQAPRRRSARAAPSRMKYLALAVLLVAIATALIVWKGRAAPTKPRVLPTESAEADPTRPAPADLALGAAPATPAASQPKTFIATVQDVFTHVKSNAQALQGLLDGQKSQQATLTKLEHDVGEIAAAITQMKQSQLQAAAVPRAPAHRVAKAPARPAVAAAPTPQRAAQLLAVDIWDGKPSVVIGTNDPADRVRFLREGDQQNGVVVKQADPRRQRAVFDVAGHEVEMLRDVPN